MFASTSLTMDRGRKMRTKFFCTNFLNIARGPGHPGKIPGTSRIPLFETQGRQSFEGGHEVFGHHPFAWKTPTPPGGLRTQKLNLCALFSCLSGRVQKTYLLWFFVRTQNLDRAKGGGAKRTEKQNLARMARRKPFFETIQKCFLRRSPEGNSGSL